MVRQIKNLNFLLINITKRHSSMQNK